MTETEREIALALAPGRVRYPVASPPKRLARSLAAQAAADNPLITDAQAEAMMRQAWTYRRQIPDDLATLARARIAVAYHKADVAAAAKKTLQRAADLARSAREGS